MFLQIEDTLPSLRAYRFTQITDGDDAVFIQAAIEAESQIFQVLDGAGYNASNILGQAGGAREQMLVAYARHIAVYKIYERIPDEQVPERVVKNYDDTMQQLRMIADGRMNLSLTRKALPDGGKQTKFRGGSTKAARRE